MDDLDKPLEELTHVAPGVDHTSRTGIQDDGCAWTERADSVEAVYEIQVLAASRRGSLSATSAGVVHRFVLWDGRVVVLVERQGQPRVLIRGYAPDRRGRC